MQVVHLMLFFFLISAVILQPFWCMTSASTSTTPLLSIVDVYQPSFNRLSTYLFLPLIPLTSYFLYRKLFGYLDQFFILYFAGAIFGYLSPLYTFFLAVFLTRLFMDMEMHQSFTQDAVLSNFKALLPKMQSIYGMVSRAVRSFLGKDSPTKAKPSNSVPPATLQYPNENSNIRARIIDS